MLTTEQLRVQNNLKRDVEKFPELADMAEYVVSHIFQKEKPVVYEYDERIATEDLAFWSNTVFKGCTFTCEGLASGVFVGCTFQSCSFDEDTLTCWYFNCTFTECSSTVPWAEDLNFHERTFIDRCYQVAL